METPPKWLSIGYSVLFAVLPWSMEADFGHWSMSLPGEPLIGILGIGLVCLFWKEPAVLRRAFFSSFFIQISLVYLVWMAFSACFSDLPIVSWKYWLVASGHWWVFAVGISVWPALWQRAFPWFAYSMGGVAIYTIIHHSFYHFRADQALLAPMPFFPDHTMWAAAVSMVLFLLFAQKEPSVSAQRFPQISTLLFLILLGALMFSTCRAAWISVLSTVVAVGFVILGKTGRLTLFLGLLLAGFFLIKQGAVQQDVSALERVNRWSCALRMAQGRPLLGFGPGTFQFQFQRYQKPDEMTRISIQEPIDSRSPDNFGRGGGVHSEYLQALVETGLPGFSCWLLLVCFVLWSGFLKRSDQTILPFLLALLTFCLHTMVNDFLHDGRIAALVWGAMAMTFAAKKED